MPGKPRKKKPQGFASFSPEKQKALARKGGKIAKALERAHRFTHDEAVAAGSKGGKVVRPRDTSGLHRGPGKLQLLILDELDRRERFPLAELCQATRGKPWAKALYQAAKTLADRGLIGRAKDGNRVICVRVQNAGGTGTASPACGPGGIS